MEIKTPYIEIKNKKYETKDFNIKLFEIGSIFIIKFTKGNDTIYFGTKDLKNLIKLKPITDSKVIEKNGDFIIETKIVGYENTSYIDIHDKEYCFELLSYENGYKINFITTNPNKGCNISEQDCKSLNYLFSVIYELLKIENFNGSLYLTDDSIINGVFTIIFNLINDKDSIYCKYGFEYSKEGLEKLEKNKHQLVAFQNYLYEHNYPIGRAKIDETYKNLLRDFKRENGNINVRNILMILPDFQKYILNYEKCKFNQSCGFKIKEDIGSQQSLELEEGIPLTQPQEEDYELIIILNYNEYLENFLRSNKKINEDLFPLNLNVEKLNIEVKKNIIRIFYRVLNQYGLYLRMRPLRIDDRKKGKEWIKKNSRDYILIQRILAYYLLVGMKKISMMLLEILVKLHKQNKELLTEDDIKKFNKIISAYYGYC